MASTSNIEENLFPSEDEDICDLAISQYEEAGNCQTYRFGNPVTDHDISVLGEQRIPANTRKNMVWSVNAFKSWRVSRNRLFINRVPSEEVSSYLIPWTPLEDMNDDELNEMLPKFIMETRKQTGDRYPATSLFQMVSSLQGFIRMKGNQVGILKDPKFIDIQNALDSEMKKSTMSSLPKPKQADIVDATMEDKMWEDALLGCDSPKKLLDTMMFTLGFNFALRASEHKNLNVDEQIEVCTDELGRQYLHYQETVSKTHDGGLKSRKKEPRSSRAYSNDDQPERCPVRIYQEYISRCPTVNRPQAFYLHPLPNVKPGAQVWFARRPVGIHVIESFVKNLAEKTGNEGKFTPHSLRASNATRLFRAGVPEQLIMEQTGHSSLAVRKYKRTSSEMKQEVSSILHKSTSKANKFKLIPKEKADSEEDFDIPKAMVKKTKTSIPAAVSIPPVRTAVVNQEKNVQQSESDDGDEMEDANVIFKLDKEKKIVHQSKVVNQQKKLK